MALWPFGPPRGAGRLAQTPVGYCRRSAAFGPNLGTPAARQGCCSPQISPEDQVSVKIGVALERAPFPICESQILVMV